MEPIAQTTSGRLRGRERRGLLLFAGIPYAAAPVGEGRFRPPRPHEGWVGVRDATRFGKVAPQQRGALGGLLDGGEPDWDEDCLFLNVLTPALDDARRPVMVWIHGGGFVSGSGSVPWYDGTNLAGRGDVVVVTINYRLGAFGFLELSHHEPSFEGSGNCGLLDQVAALEWVRDNIASFGGDPARITVFGESAGAMSIGALMGMPAAKGLFAQAILQSGAAHNVAPREAAQETTDLLLEQFGTRDVGVLVDARPEELLRAQGRLAEMMATGRIPRRAGSAMGLPFGPVIDGSVLPEPPIRAIAAGSAAEVRTIVGTNRDEFRLFTLTRDQAVDMERLGRRLRRLFSHGERLLDAYRALFPHADAGDLWNLLMTDGIFRIPAIRLCEAQCSQGAVWLYRFDWATPVLGGRLGSCHALEIPFVFDNLDKAGVALFCGDDPPRVLAREMSQAWLDFANGRTQLQVAGSTWREYDLDVRHCAVFDRTCRHESDPDSEIRAIWEGIL
ncbi:MAG: carboxylesterase [Acidimicrobiales bacterium]|nr:MAG: carboxylesterase [Acidimicrobiales bacterium]